MSIEEAAEYAKKLNMDFIETSALNGSCVEQAFRRLALSVAKELPEVAIHLDLSYLPEGWMVCCAPLCETSEQSKSIEKGSSSPTPSDRMTSVERSTLDAQRRYVNYWTGETTCVIPTEAAPTGLLYSIPPSSRKDRYSQRTSADGDTDKEGLNRGSLLA